MLSISLRLCRVRLGAHGPSARDLVSILSTSERERCARLSGFHSDRALVARAMVRSELAAALGIAPSALEFVTGRHGKPEVFDPPQPIAFNLSHSGEWVVLAWQAGSDAISLGVDVEQFMADRRDVMRLARRFFSLPEQLALEALTGDARETLFYRLWTLKEAWVKAHGLALAPQLGKLAFSVNSKTLDVVNATALQTGRFFHGEAGVDGLVSLCALSDDDCRIAVDARVGMPLGDWSPMSLAGWRDSIGVY